MMRHDEFHAFVDYFIKGTKEILDQRNLAYATDADPFANFEETAAFFGSDKYHACLPHLHKHYRALVNEVRQEKPRKHVVHEHCMDIINYCIFIAAFSEDEGYHPHEAPDLSTFRYYESPDDQREEAERQRIEADYENENVLYDPKPPLSQEEVTKVDSSWDPINGWDTNGWEPITPQDPWDYTEGNDAY